MKRRTFIHHATHSLALPGLLGSFGFSVDGEEKLKTLLTQAAQANKVLVLIYLQGGNDGLNTVIPLDQLSNLNKVRPQVVMPDTKLIKLNSSVGLHPSLNGFSNLYKEGKLNIVQSVGYQDQSFSHFRSTDIWMSGSGASNLVTSGWAGRYLYNVYPSYPTGFPSAENPDPLAVEIGYGASMIFQGPSALMTTVISDPTNFYQLINDTNDTVPATNAGNKLGFVRLIAKQSQQYGVVLKNAAAKVTTQKPYPSNNSLANELKVVSRLVAGGLSTSLYLVRMGGFDTHDAQVDATDHTIGKHANLLKNLDEAVTAFMADLKFLGVDDKVVGMTFSEFGRRIISNAGNGTDHGAAAPMFVFGNKVLGGISGKNPVIPATANYNDNLDKQFDYRQIYSSVLQQWFGTTAGTASNLLNSTFSTVPIINDGTVTALLDIAPIEPIVIYPNPVNQSAKIEFISSGSLSTIELVNLDGKHITTLHSGIVPTGKQTIDWNASTLPSGNYIALYRTGNQQFTQRVIKE